MMGSIESIKWSAVSKVLDKSMNTPQIHPFFSIHKYGQPIVKWHDLHTSLIEIQIA